VQAGVGQTRKEMLIGYAPLNIEVQLNLQLNEGTWIRVGTSAMRAMVVSTTTMHFYRGPNGCDEKREKASTNFFEDTALMALVCRHD
jgi:hypothetical protein